MRELILVFVVLFCRAQAAEVEWLRAGIHTNAPVWGIRGGLQFAIHPAGFAGREGGPRGLIRIGYPTLSNSQYDLINFIAVEPIVKGKKGFSELEKSDFDQKAGKMFWTGKRLKPPADHSDAPLDQGALTTLSSGVQQLSLDLSVERFENGAHVRLRLTQRSDRPGEVQFTVEAEPDSAPIEMCVLTATMGNKSRARLLSLDDGPVSSLQLYPDYRDHHFSPHRIFGIDRLPRLANGDVFISIQNDEEDPASVRPFNRPHFWDYLGAKVTQYWRKPATEVTSDLVCAVNARFTYWGGAQPIPGGVSFENFELREPFRSGQTFTFGITTGSVPSVAQKD